MKTLRKGDIISKLNFQKLRVIRKDNPMDCRREGIITKEVEKSIDGNDKESRSKRETLLDGVRKLNG